MAKFDFRDQTDIAGWPNMPNEREVWERIQSELNEFETTHRKIYRQDRHDAFYKAVLPVLKHFSFIHSAVLEVEETGQTIVAKITCEVFHIMEEDAIFIKIFEYADLRSITVTDENLPMITLYFPCVEIVGN